MSKLSTKYYLQKDFKFLPADAETTISMNIKDLFNLHPTYEINNIYYSIYKSGALKRMRHTDRKYRSSHNSINIKKHIHNIRHKVQQSYTNEHEHKHEHKHKHEHEHKHKHEHEHKHER